MWFITDMIVNFRTGYVEEGYLVLDDWLAARNYLRGSFFIDFAPPTAAAGPTMSAVGFKDPSGKVKFSNSVPLLADDKELTIYVIIRLWDVIADVLLDARRFITEQSSEERIMMLNWTVIDVFWTLHLRSTFPGSRVQKGTLSCIYTSSDRRSQNSQITS